jgi:quercetin dioxygenase-like cupin family protein
MRILELGSMDFREISQFDSTGFSVAAIGVLKPGHVSLLRLEAGGVIGRHPAVGVQLLVVLDGRAKVSGEYGVPAEVTPGQAVVWEPGENHETRSENGATALVVEGSWESGPEGHN